jgi:hypothetical protein
MGPETKIHYADEDKQQFAWQTQLTISWQLVVSS